MEALPGDAATFLVLFARLGAVLLLLPAFSDEAVPGQIRLLISIGLSAGLYGLLSPRVAPAAVDGGALIGVLLAEVLTGLMIGMIVRIVFHAAAIAGSIIAVQTGLSSALVPDASQGGQAALLSRYMYLAAVVVCLAAGLHHEWLRAIVQSYRMFPVGGLPATADFARLGVTAVSTAMSLAVSLAGPLLVYGMVFNIGLGLVSRLTPQIQIFFIAQPLNLLLGLGLFAVTIGASLAAFAEAMQAWTRGLWS